jgi:hypothetical protein
MTDIFVKTKDEAKKERKRLTDEANKAHYTKLKHEYGYIVWTIPRMWGKVKQ